MIKNLYLKKFDSLGFKITKLTNTLIVFERYCKTYCYTHVLEIRINKNTDEIHIHSYDKKVNGNLFNDSVGMTQEECSLVYKLSKKMLKEYKKGRSYL